MRKPAAASIFIVAGALSAFAAAPAAAEPIRPGETDGLGLGLFGHSVPAVLQQAKADPYAAPVGPACRTIPQEIAALDAVLGPDADQPAERTRIRTRAEKLVFQGLRGMIPHRDVVRFVTGANRRDKALSDAAMAGWARRGFLKGMEVNLGCARAAAARWTAFAPITSVGQSIQAAAPVAAVGLHRVDESVAR